MGPIVVLVQHYRPEIILPRFRVFGLALEGDGDRVRNRGFIRRVPRLGDGDIALVGDHLKGVGYGVGAVAPLVLGGVGLVVEVVGITASLYRFIHEVVGTDGTVSLPVGLQLTHPVLAKRQAGDGGALLVVVVVRRQGDHQVLALVSGVLYCDPVLAILLLYHKADEPLKRTAGSGPGAVLVVAVVPDLFDGQALELQLVGGDVAFGCERGAIHQVVVIGFNFVCYIAAVVLHGDLLSIDAGLYHPVLQEHGACSLRFTYSVLDQDRMGQAADGLGVPLVGTQGSGDAGGKLVGGIGTEQLLIHAILIFQNLREERLGILPSTILFRFPYLDLEVYGQCLAVQEVLGNRVAVLVLPDLGVGDTGLGAVFQLRHGDNTIVICRCRVGGHGTGLTTVDLFQNCVLKAVLVGHCLRDPIRPRHTVGGDGFQTGDGVGPSISGVRLRPCEVSTFSFGQLNSLPVNRISLTALRFRTAFQFQRDTLRPQAECVVEVFPLLCAGDLNRRLHRHVLEGGPVGIAGSAGRLLFTVAEGFDYFLRVELGHLGFAVL